MLNASKLLAWPFRDVERSYEEKDAILYALALGLGTDATNPNHLRYVFEKGLKTFATFPLVLGMVEDLGFLHDAEVGIDLPRMLHGETGMTLHKPLPARGRVVSRMSIERLIDKGPERGAALQFSRTIRDADSKVMYAKETGIFLLRGNGGFGGTNGSTDSPAKVPERAPDASIQLPTLPQSALLYRLTGDRNLLHVDPAIAKKIGFERPILHGACSYGIASVGVVRLLCEDDSSRLRSIFARFTAPVLPGEKLEVQVWRLEPGTCAFRVIVPERQRVVLDNGHCQFEEAA